MKISDTIFRAYDIRGIYNDDITDETAYTLGKSFGTYVLESGATEVLVGHDNRLSSPVLSENLIKGLLETGVNVTDLGLVTTPMYYYARSFLNKWAAVMITASHNPSNHNGFKISFDSRGNAAGEEIQAFKDYTNAGNFVTGKGTYSSYDIRESYINLLVNSLKMESKKIKLVIDCGNGTCSLVVKDILDKLNVTYDLLYCESDGNFPNHHPDPSVSSNLVDLQKRVLELNYDLGIAVDADGDRVRIIDNKGNIINSDIFMVVMYRYLNDSLKVRKALFDVKCSKALLDALDDLKIEKIMYRTAY
jgi:phosphomannomutase/phosphoglucomutase